MYAPEDANDIEERAGRGNVYKGCDVKCIPNK